jgi:hypothetical protein
MADYRALAQALDPYAMDTGGITPDTLKALQSGYKSPNLLGMIGDIGRGGLSNLESLVRGGVAQFGGTPVDTLNTIRTPYPMEVMGDVNYAPDKQVYGGTKDILGMMPKRVTQTRPETAGMEELGTVMGPGLAKAAMPAVRAGQKGLNLLGMEVADRVATGQSVLPSLLKEPQSAMFAVNPADQMAQAVTKAEVSPLGFYSAVEQQALKIPRKQGSGDSFLNDLMKGQDVKKYEIEAMGLENYLRGKPNVTRQEVQDFIANNRIDVQEKILGGNEAPSQDLLSWMSSRNIMQPRNPEGWQELSQKLERYAQQHQKAQGAPEASQRYFTLSEEAGRIAEGLDAGGSAAGATKYQKYQLPGGDNYRELLLTLPNQWEKPRAAQIANEAKIKTLRQEMHGTSGTDQIRSEISRLHNENTNLQKQISEAPIYKSSHFDEPNILAHMRVNDRVDAEGKKMLLIEEVQSDWHQAGREKGYQNKSGQYGEKVSPEEYKRGVALQNQQRNQSEPLTASEQAELNDIMGRHEASIAGARVPDAPFKDTWHQLALKRAIKEAVDKGYDRIGLTTGAQQAERYNLSNHVQDLTLHGTGDNLRLSATSADGTHKVIDMQDVTPKTLPNYIGKEAAQKLLAQPEPNPENPYAARNLFGVDLQVGGEGMKKYYDEVYPNYLNKLGKKYGAQVGETRIKTGRGVPGGEPVRYLDITPEMRKAIKEGQPLASIEEELAKALA